MRLFHSTRDPPRPETEPISPAFAGRFLTPSGSDSEESACDAGDPALLPASGRSPGGGHGHPLQNSCLETPHGQRSLAGYRPRGRKELDTNEQE